ncbi:transposase [Ferrimonas sediminicola]|uniref:Transposase n=1 Tax=Ferrimonas sediminicola TaxID=2569538 RepID=A0A4U1BG62_9GAMM|nr:IS21-like element helper ATPase IstB [Ferrimonas sediminicola]TKB50302.1 transposase [Ferrimonas sediminicola]
MTQAVYEQLRQLRLSHLAQALEQQQAQPGTYLEMDFCERLTLLLQHELDHRESNRVNRLRKQAKLRLQAQASQLDYRVERGLSRKQMAELLNGQYLHQSRNVLITGPTGSGKTYVACALGEQACQQHRRVGYYRLPRLLGDLVAGHADGSYNQQLTQLSKKELLILDDWGLEKLTGRQASDLLEVMEERYRRGSTVIASQLPISEWYQMISNATVADALLDRLLHHSHRLELKGESMRKLEQSDHLA